MGVNFSGPEKIEKEFEFSQKNPKIKYKELVFNSNQPNKSKNKETSDISSCNYSKKEEFYEVPILDLKTILNETDIASNLKFIRSIRKVSSSIYCSEIINDTLRYDEFSNFKVLRGNNRELKDLALIMNTLEEVVFLKIQCIHRNLWIEFIKEMPYCQVEKNVILTRQNTIGSMFYFLKEGRVKIVVDNEIVASVTAPKTLGERALFNDFIRGATLITEELCYFYVIKAENFKKIFEILNETQGVEEKYQFIESHYTLSLVIDNYRVHDF